MTKPEAVRIITLVTLANPTLKLERAQVEYWAERLLRFEYTKAIPRIQAFCDRHVGPPPSLGELVTAISGGSDIERQQAARRALGSDLTGTGQLEESTNQDQVDRVERLARNIGAARAMLESKGVVAKPSKGTHADDGTPEGRHWVHLRYQRRELTCSKCAEGVTA